jgi:hypothetical protein
MFGPYRPSSLDDAEEWLAMLTSNLSLILPRTGCFTGENNNLTDWRIIFGIGHYTLKTFLRTVKQINSDIEDTGHNKITDIVQKDRLTHMQIYIVRCNCVKICYGHCIVLLIRVFFSVLFNLASTWN